MAKASAQHIPATGDRIWARLIDELMITVFLIPAFGAAAFGLFATDRLWLSWGLFVYLLLIPVLYEGVGVWLFGTTVGKWVFSLSVVDRGGRSLSLGASLLRALAGRLSLFFSHAVQALAFLNVERRHIADWLAETKVVSGRARRDPATRRLWFGLILVGAMGLSGLTMASVLFKATHWNGSGVYFQLDNDVEGAFERIARRLVESGR